MDLSGCCGSRVALYVPKGPSPRGTGHVPEELGLQQLFKLHGAGFMGSKHDHACLFFRWLYEGISREKAEELLMLPPNRKGSFLIRKSQMMKGIGDSPLKPVKNLQGRKLISSRNTRRNMEFSF